MTEPDDKVGDPEVKVAVPARTKKIAKTRKKAAMTSSAGVIETIIAILKQGGGTTEQIATKLAKKFPDRDADGLAATVRTQMFRLRKEKGLRIKTTKQKGTKALLYRL